ncbi:MAG: hypothetical protein HKN33_02775 [Pyrinomonadaceae bacterium]|nr:hypothetical protein [Pyrinomonadaceae bacterium]
MTKVNEEIHDFVREALSKGHSREEIENVLGEAGWPVDQIADSLNAFAKIDFPVPVPKPRPYVSAKEAFLYLIFFTTLFISAYNLGVLIFQFIDLGFPDPADPIVSTEYIMETIRWSVSTLVVVFPVFLFVAYWVKRAVRKDPAKRASKIRKWLTYMTLFVAAGTLIGDLTTLVYSFLGGEITIRFLLKALTVGGISGSIFGYFLWDSQREEREE